jgi:hypothetical protein
MREFPIINGTGKDAKSSGAKRQLEYGLRGNEFTVKQLSKDSTDVSTKTSDKQPVKAEEKKSSEKQNSSSSKSSKKKHKRHRG